MGKDSDHSETPIAKQCCVYRSTRLGEDVVCLSERRAYMGGLSIPSTRYLWVYNVLLRIVCEVHCTSPVVYRFAVLFSGMLKSATSVMAGETEGVWVERVRGRSSLLHINHTLDNEQ